MGLLLDTHAFLWFVFGDEKLPPTARNAIGDPTNEVYLSLASVWEMTIKHGLGKLPLDRPLRDFILHETSANDFTIRHVSTDHVLNC